jgi:hypothetical protein
MGYTGADGLAKLAALLTAGLLFPLQILGREQAAIEEIGVADTAVKKRR